MEEFIMTAFKKLKLAHVLTLALLFVSVGLITEANAYKSKSNREAMVSVEVKPVQLTPGQPAKFEVKMNTHSVELDQDMVVVSTLVDDNGTTYQPLEWNGSKPGSHHRRGTLIFPNLKGNPKSVTLVIRGIANVPERVFEWKIEN